MYNGDIMVKSIRNNINDEKVNIDKTGRIIIVSKLAKRIMLAIKEKSFVMININYYYLN